MAEIEVKVVDRTPELMQKLDAAIGRFVVKGSEHINREVRASMAEAKTGTMYGTHQASAPGESPAVDSGNYIGSIVIIYPSTFEALIGTPVEYALYLEEGTRPPATRASRRKKDQQGPVLNMMGPHMGGMAPRPLWEKTMTESLPTLENLLDAEIAGIATRV